MLFWDLGSECLSILRTGTGKTEYLLTAADSEGKLFALGRRGSVYELVMGDGTGRRTGRWELSDQVLTPESRPTLLYPAAGGAVYLGLYQVGEDGTDLQLYRISDEGKAWELLLNQPCQGENLSQQMASLRLSSFSQVDNVVTFAVIEGDTAHFYQRTSANSGLQELRSVSEEGLYTAVALSDGSLVLAGESRLVRTGGETISLENGEVIVRLLPGGTGMYYVDGASLEVYYADYADWRPYSFLALTKDAYDMDCCTDLWVTRSGDVLLLMDGQRLLVDRGSEVSELTGMLYRPAAQCVLILLGLGLGVLVVTVLLWYLVCEQRRFRLPMLVRWGVVIAWAAALGVGSLLRWGVAPAARTAAEREASSLLGSVTAQELQHWTLGDGDLPQQLGNSLAGAAGGDYWDTSVSVYQVDGEGNWTLVGSNDALPVGVRGELSPSFDRSWAQESETSGRVTWTDARGGTAPPDLLPAGGRAAAGGGYRPHRPVGGGRARHPVDGPGPDFPGRAADGGEPGHSVLDHHRAQAGPQGPGAPGRRGAGRHRHPGRGRRAVQPGRRHQCLFGHPPGAGPEAKRAGPVLSPVRARAGAVPSGQDQHRPGGQTDLCLPAYGHHDALLPVPTPGLWKERPGAL